MTWILAVVAALWIGGGCVIAHQIDMVPIQKIGLVIVWPFLALYAFAYHMLWWPRRFY